jgi:hypothetical protein
MQQPQYSLPIGNPSKYIIKASDDIQKLAPEDNNINNILDLVKWAKANKLYYSSKCLYFEIEDARKDILYHMYETTKCANATKETCTNNIYCTFDKTCKLGNIQEITESIYKKVNTYDDLLEATIKLFDYTYLYGPTGNIIYESIIIKKHLINILKNKFMTFYSQPGLLIKKDNNYLLHIPFVEVANTKDKIFDLMNVLADINKEYPNLYNLAITWNDRTIEEMSEIRFSDSYIAHFFKKINNPLIDELKKTHFSITLTSAPEYWYNNDLFFGNIVKATNLINKKMSDGGLSYYDKYRKYKTKYLQLKNS